MALTSSHMLFPLGAKAPDFNLEDVLLEKMRTLAQLRGKNGTVICFMCNHCPYVQHILHKLLEIARMYLEKGIAFIGINANDTILYPQDGKEPMSLLAKKENFPFPYLLDASQAIAKAYKAACTPDFYCFDASLLCVYRGRFDASSPGNNLPVTGEALTQTLDALLTGHPIDKNQKPSMGCNIKWALE